MIKQLICDCATDSLVVLELMQKLLSCKMKRVKGQENVVFKRFSGVNATFASDSQGNIVGCILNNDNEYNMYGKYYFTELIEMKSGRAKIIIEPEFRYSIEDVYKIVVQQINELSNQLLRKGIDIRLTDDALVELTKAAYNPIMDDSKVPHIINEYIVKDLTHDLQKPPLCNSTDHAIIVDAKVVNDNVFFGFLKSGLPKRTI